MNPPERPSSMSTIVPAKRGLEIAREAGVTTIFNPAPAARFDDDLYSLCDYLTPNENEAGLLTAMTVANLDDARKAGDAFLEKGVGTSLITLGEAGALLHGRMQSTLIPAFKAG